MYKSQIWLTATKYPYLKWKWIFYILTYIFLLYHCQDFYRMWLYIWVTRWMSYKKQELFTLSEHLGSPSVFGGVHIAHLFSFLCCFLLSSSCLLCTQSCLCLWIAPSVFSNVCSKQKQFAFVLNLSTFCLDPLTNMATTGNSCFWLDDF